MAPRTVQFALVLVALLAGACRRRPAPELPPEDDKDPPPPRAAAAPVRPRCTAEPVRWLLGRPPDAGAAGGATLEGGALAHGPGGDWVAWLDPAAAVLAVSTPGGAVLRDALGAGEASAPIVVAVGDAALLAWVAQRGAAERVHRVAVATGGGLRPLFTQAEQPDDGLSIAAAPTATGVVLAWDDARAEGGGVIASQWVARAALAGPGPVAPPPVRILSPPEHDAADPVLVPMPGGGAAVLWLASEEIDASVANQTAADLYVRTLGPDGAPSSPAVRFTPGSANRFAVTALGHVGALWVAYRVAGDADQESRGDGGAVALVRLGSDLRPTTTPVYLTERDALPTGALAVLPTGEGVTVFWTERRAEGLRTMRRRVEPDGRLVVAAQDEPALQGELPAWGDGESMTAVAHGPRGELGLFRARCPAQAGP